MRYRILVLLFLVVGITASAIGQPQNEQVLVPFDTAVVAGNDGALWSAELRVRNGSDSEINLFPEQCFTPGLGQLPCGKKIPIPPQTTNVLRVLNGLTPTIRDDLHGLLLYVPTNRIDDVQFSLRVRDARSQDPVGTTLPVVRVQNLRSRYTIVGVPVSSGLRRTLRVYEPHLGVQSVFRIRVFDEADNRMILDREYMGGSPTDPPSPALVPATFDFSDALAGPAQAATYVSVSIERVFPETLTFWPMISVTSNIDHRIAIFVAN